MDGNEVCVKRNKIGKTRKHTRWKGGERVPAKAEKGKRKRREIEGKVMEEEKEIKERDHKGC